MKKYLNYAGIEQCSFCNIYKIRERGSIDICFWRSPWKEKKNLYRSCWWSEFCSVILLCKCIFVIVKFPCSYECYYHIYVYYNVLDFQLYVYGCILVNPDVFLGKKKSWSILLAVNNDTGTAGLRDISLGIWNDFSLLLSFYLREDMSCFQTNTCLLMLTPETISWPTGDYL